jgi:single-strand DNA-binding protein
MPINKQILMGHIGQIEKKSFEWGSVTKFSVATNEKYTRKDGQKVEETTWFNCEAFGNIADTIEKYFKKGDPIYVEGKTKTEKYEKDGIERTVSKVKVEMFSFIPATKQADREVEPIQPAPQEPANAGAVEDESDLPF